MCCSLLLSRFIWPRQRLGISCCFVMCFLFHKNDRDTVRSLKQGQSSPNESNVSSIISVPLVYINDFPSCRTKSVDTIRVDHAEVQFRLGRAVSFLVHDEIEPKQLECESNSLMFQVHQFPFQASQTVPAKLYGIQYHQSRERSSTFDSVIFHDQC